MSANADRGAAFECRRLNTLVYADRFAASVSFYRDGLGLPARFANAWFVEFQVNAAACVSVVEKASTRMRGTASVPQTITFEVADLDAVSQALASRGLTPGETRRHGFGARVFYLRDPEGNRLEFWTPA